MCVFYRRVFHIEGDEKDEMDHLECAAEFCKNKKSQFRFDFIILDELPSQAKSHKRHNHAHTVTNVNHHIHSWATLHTLCKLQHTHQAGHSILSVFVIFKLISPYIVINSNLLFPFFLLLQLLTIKEISVCSFAFNFPTTTTTKSHP